jgi:tetratricopeptide (TPR) repeat protein
VWCGEYCQLDSDTVSGISEHTGEERITVYLLQMSMAADRSQSSKIKSPKQRREAKNNRSLIGREMQQDWFQKSLVRPDDHESRIIFSISGQGGVGKTTLLKDFRRIAEEFSHVCAYVDEGVATNPVNDVPEVMWRLAEDFERQGFKFDEFQKRYKDYRVKKQELEASPEGPKGLMGDMVRGGTKMALEIGKDLIPGGGLIDSEMVATKTGELANYGWERFRNKDDERLMRETLEELTPLFLKGMARVPIEKTVVLLLDTYEVTGAFLEPWVLALLEEEFGAVGREFMVCIGGRNPLDRNVWTDWESCIARSPLEPFTEAEARQFLAQKGILGEAVISEIWRLSAGGLPLLVSMMALNAPTGIDAVVDTCDDAVTRFLKWETDEAKRTLALDGALARAIDSDVVLALGSELFDWLRGCPFVIREGSVWRYHSVVRELMVRFQWQKSRKHWTDVHGKLAAHYETVRVGLGLESGKEIKDKEWRRLSLEWFYHSLCAGRQAQIGMALNGFLVALKESGVYARKWAEVMVQVGKEVEWVEVKRWGEQLRDAMIAHSEKRYSDAIPSLTKLLESMLIEPKRKAVAYNWRGRWLRDSKQGDLGLQDFLKAVELDGEDAKHHFDLAYTYRAEKRYEKAIDSYQKAIELNPEYTYAYNNLGITYYGLKRYEEAIDSYQKAIELSPEYANAYFNLGSTYYAQKQYEDAIGACQKTIKLNPKDANAYYSLGITYNALKRYEEAIGAYQKAIAIDPEYANAYYNLGRTYNALKRYEEAIGAYQRRIELNPDDATAYNNLGNTYKSQKHYEDAIGAYQRAIELNPEYATAYNNLGSTYNNLKRYEDAIVAYSKAIELNPEDATAYNNLGITYYALKRYEDAIVAYSKAIELNPEFATAYNNLGITYKELKQYEEAIGAYQKAIELNPEKADSLGLLQYNLGDFQSSLSTFQKSLELQPSQLMYLSNICYLHLLQGDLDEAEKVLEGMPNKDDFDRAWLNYGLIQSQRGNIKEAMQSWQNGANLMKCDNEWDKAVHCVFTVALGNIPEGLQQIQNLINDGTGEFTLKNALNDATLILRSPYYPEGIEDMVQLLQTALSSMETI